jgi:HTH-type transcriptional regulator, sugar sensing transcriptional regulator
MQPAAERWVGRLTELGFSKYEAQAYVGLLAADSMTGYGLSNTTGIPQPKVYETLRRLAERGAAVKVSDSPARYSAVPAERLFEELESQFRERLEGAQADFQDIPTGGTGEWHEAIVRMDGYEAVCSRAERMIAGTQTKLYVSGWAPHLTDLKQPLQAADRRDVEIVALYFGGALSFEIEHGHGFRHASTEGALYRHHRSRQLAVVADSTSVMWALAPDGDDWSGIYSEDMRLIMVVKAYVRHDIYVQKLNEQLGEQMRKVFGPGLEYLTNVASNEVLAPASKPAASEDGKRAAG